VNEILDITRVGRAAQQLTVVGILRPPGTSNRRTLAIEGSDMKRLNFKSAALFATFIVLQCAAQFAYGQTSDQMQVVHITYKRGMNPAAPAATQPNIVYNGGPVLPHSTTYAIFWGNPGDFPPDLVAGVDQFLSGLNGSPFLAIADQYMLGNKATTRFGGNLFDYSSPPPAVPRTSGASTNGLGNHFCQFLHSSGVRPDPTAIYFLYTSNYPPDALSNKGGGYCAFHGYQICSEDGGPGTVYYAVYVPNLTSEVLCSIDTATYPFGPAGPFLGANNYSSGTQSVLNATAHEFMESITDPQLNAWTNSDGSEIGDPCAYLSQSWVQLANSSRWTIQEIWSNQVNGCVQGDGAPARLVGAASNWGNVTTFDIPGATYGVFGLDVNSNGEIAGNYYDSNNSFVTAGFLRASQGNITTINFPGAVWTDVVGVTASGSVAGAYSAATGTHGFVRDSAGKFTSFDVLNSNSPFVSTINGPGTVVGSYIDAARLIHGFVRDRLGNITSFDAPNSPYQTVPFSINDNGAITGFYSLLNQPHHGFVRDPLGNITTLDVPAGVNGTRPMSINAEGAIAGSYTDTNFVRHGFVRDAYGTITTFDAPGAVYGTIARRINRYGEVAGFFSDANAVSHGFLRDANGNFTILTDIPYGLNDSSTATGYVLVP
jgi:predicted membrane protein